MGVFGPDRRALALAGAALLVTGVLAGCGGDAVPEASEPPATRSMPPATAGAEPGSAPLPTALTSQRPDWQRCEAPGAGGPPAPTGGAPPSRCHWTTRNRRAGRSASH
ncbi:hypothetical protein Sfulv_40410 [Streptomyces fulvorobeus]|uniref:Lipoprotein n=1 Tax=Streptomyces fulvorobeus TaxID=284028 RepID=A0A7J0C9M1_9ACTN|nr:hypothetical protein Sfulv_40410 [Streptomyces fulvorobeus]